MNQKDRAEMAEIIEALEILAGRIETLQSAEQDKYDNMPKGLQQAERGQAIENAADNLSSAKDSVDEAVSTLQDIE